MYMFKYICKRIGLMIMTFTIIFVTCFVLIKLLPVDTTSVGVGEDANKLLAQLEARGYNKPILEQFGLYVKRIVLDGDFGIGVNMPEYRGHQVWNVFIEKLPPTILINIYSSLLAVPIGIALGILAALKKNKWQDQLINIFIILLISVPGIVLALMLQYVFCFKLGWFPLMMSTSDDYFSWEVFRSMIPAVFALCLGSIAGYARYTRAELSEVLTGEFMLLARTKGLTKRQAVMRHALRNSMVVIFPSILSEFVAVLSGSLIIERMFGINGVGGLYLNSITFQDYDFFMLLSGFYTLVSLSAAIVIDISYGFIDPRIRMGAK